MRINHLIIGADSIVKSVNFYCELFNFENIGTFVDTGTSSKGEILSLIQDNHLFQLLIVPFKRERLPNPQHIAFEVDKKNFTNIYDKAIALNIKIRKNPAMNSTEFGIGTLDTILCSYNIFYLTDPSKINIEVMCVQ